jgi:hypothetical protein
MTLRKGLAGCLAIAVAFTGMTAWGDAPEAGGQGAAPSTTAPEEPVFGRQMMTEQEMAAHHARMRAAKTPEEREQVRQAHHQQMVERAKQRGITLPEQPMGPGPGHGMGRGMGPGKGRGVGPPGGTSGEPSAP